MCSAGLGGSRFDGTPGTGGSRISSLNELPFSFEAEAETAVGTMARNDKRRAAVTRAVDLHLEPDVMVVCTIQAE